MVKDQPNLKKHVDKEMVLAAIQALTTKGFDINPYTVAEEAGIVRSALYRKSEYMDLIHQARGENIADGSVEGLRMKIGELEERTKELEETIWNLEAQNEQLMQEQQSAWHQGFQAGHEEAARKYKAPGSLTHSALDTGDLQALQMPVSERHIEPPELKYAEESQPEPQNEPLPHYGAETQAAQEQQFEAPQAEVAVSDEGEEAGYEPVSQSTLQLFAGLDTPAQGHPGNGAHQVHEAPAVQATPEPRPAPVPEPAAKPPQKPPSAKKAPVHQPSAEELAATAAARAAQNAADTAEIGRRSQALLKARNQDGVFNAARGGPYVASNYNPLVELSWRDVEAVYNFAASSLKDIGKQLPEPHPIKVESNPATTAAAVDPEHRVSGVPDNGPSAQVSAGYGQVQQSATTQPAAQPVSNAAAVDASAVDSNIDLENQASPSADNSGVNHSATSSGASIRHHKSSPFRESADDLQTLRAEEFGVGNDEALTVTSENLQAFNDPRDLSLSEAVVDLDAMDIFDDLEDYVDIDKIDVIEDVDVDVAESEEQKSAGDELRELIKGRIKQAADLPAEALAAREAGAQASAATAAAAADKAGAAGLGGARNKFVGGKAAPQAAPVEPAPVVRAIPADIRKACMILGVRPEDMTKQIVLQAWKNQIAAPGVHPDLGGDNEAAVYLNLAKDTLVRWLDQNGPKLGKKFGRKPGEPPAPGASVPNPPAGG